MSETERQTQPESVPPPRQTAKTSALAIAAFVVAVIPCCPFVNLAGAMMGVAALRRISASQGRLKGGRLAVSAVAIGLGLATLLSTGWLVFAYQQQQQLDTQMVQSIEVFTQAAQAGELDKARSVWQARRSVTPSDDQVRDFGRELQTRYGALERASIASHTSAGSLLAPTTDAACILVFESSKHTGAATFQLSISGSSIWPELRLTSLRVDDPVQGSLKIPDETP